LDSLKISEVLASVFVFLALPKYGCSFFIRLSNYYPLQMIHFEFWWIYSVVCKMNGGHQRIDLFLYCNCLRATFVTWTAQTQTLRWAL